MRQILICMIIEATETLKDGSVHQFGRWIEGDFARLESQTLSSFLPETLSSKSAVLIAITNDSGDMVTFVDGNLPSDNYSGIGERNWVSIDDMGPQYRSQLHDQIRRIADARLGKGQLAQDTDDLDMYGLAVSR